MFSRLKEKFDNMTHAQKHLITDCIYGVAEAGAIVAVAAYGVKLTPLDLAIAAPAVGVWFVASMHHIYRTVRTYCKEKREREAADLEEGGEQPEPRCQPVLRASTHAALNDAMHIGVSTAFLSGDAIYLSGLVARTQYTASTAILAVRSTGSSLWLLSSVIRMISTLAIRRRNEMFPQHPFTVFGMKGETSNAVDEGLFLAAGVLYTVAYSMETPVNPVKLAALALWLVAGSLDTASAIRAALRGRVIEVLDDDSEATAHEAEQSVEMARVADRVDDNAEHDLPHEDESYAEVSTEFVTVDLESDVEVDGKTGSPQFKKK